MEIEQLKCSEIIHETKEVIAEEHVWNKGDRLFFFFESRCDDSAMKHHLKEWLTPKLLSQPLQEQTDHLLKNLFFVKNKLTAEFQSTFVFTYC